MENFNEYRAQEAEKLKKIREIDKDAAQAHLEKLKTTEDYQEAEAMHRETKTEKQDVQSEPVVDKLESPEPELHNPEWEELKKWEEDTINELREILGERGDWPFNIEFDDNGELSKVLVNGVSEGYGKLGEILKEQAARDWQEHKEKERGLGKGVSLMRDDKYLINAYKTNPEVKQILDAGIAKVLELNKIRGEFRRKVVNEKTEDYKTADGLNEFLNRLGVNKKVPDYNMNDLLEQIKNCSDEELPTVIANSGRQISEIFKPFDELPLSKEQKEDLEPDRRALKQIAEQFTQAIINRSISDKRKSGDWNSNSNALEIFHTEVAKSKTGKRYLHNTILSSDRLF